VVIVLIAPRERWWWRLGLAVGATAAVEIVIELAEYPLLYAGAVHATAYYDTLADMASTLAGALAGSTAALALLPWRRP